MSKRTPCIYKITNLIDGKVYVGQTVVGYKNRVSQHLSALKNQKHKNKHLQRAWDKYGESNFLPSLIEECDVSQIDDLERKWISYYANFKGTYNLESGGNKLKKHAEESIRKMAAQNKINMQKPEVRKKLEKHWESFRGSGNPLARKVICINSGKIYDTATEAAQELGLSNKNISRVCTGQRKTAGGLQFAFYEEGKTYELKEFPSRVKGNHPSARKIICINDNKIFDSIIEASDFYEIPYKNIAQVLLGKSKFTVEENGRYLQFEYYESGKEYRLKEIEANNIKTPKRVICLTTGKVFESMHQASKVMGVNQGKISMVCNGKRQTTGQLPDGTKLKWAFYDERLSM